MIGIWIALGAVCLGSLAYWLLILTEGTYLGPRVVTLLYDWTAKRYDAIKDLHYVSEARHLGLPLAQALGHAQSPLVLDVASGTARLPLALLRQWPLGGRGLSDITVVGVDRSPRMMAQAERALADYDGRFALLQQDAGALGFGDDRFDCVTCLEALEFIRHPTEVVREMVRILRPGGTLLLSNRIGKDTTFFPRRLCGRGRVERCLRELGLQGIRTERWQVHYDLIWAHKPLPREGAHVV